jgi:hypothetical protein
MVAVGFLTIVNTAGMVWEQLKKLTNGGVDWKYTMYDTFHDVGLNIVKGIADGVKDGAFYVANGMAGLAKSTINGFKGLLDINSPSGVFMELGGYTAQGFALGIERGTGNAQDAVAGLVAVPSRSTIDANVSSLVATPRFGNGAGGVGGNVTFVNHWNVQGGSDSADVIARRLEEVLPSKMASMFEQLAIHAGAS